eukprot:TRINITY_DN34591_c0_g1_i1.p1 TRINITY_DN34591_c0_g1~~TRINITY_DN34591_c0_g1_i1.p1  ORF type:complete len:572 (-),score=32.54 TRINITY_DN34591_c0_g1_i1:32-1726(-)
MLEAIEAGQVAFQRVKGTYYRKTFFIRFGIFFLLWFLGGIVFSLLEHWPFGKALYFVTETLATIGFGGVVPVHPFSKVVLVLYSVAGLLSLCLVLVSSTTWWLHAQRHRIKYGQTGLLGRILPASFNPLYFPLISIAVLQFVVVIICAVCYSAEHIKVNGKTEKWGFLNGFYFTCTALATIGYGDFEPKTTGGMTGAVFMIIIFEVCRFIILASISHLTFEYTRPAPSAADPKEQVDSIGSLSDTKPEKVTLVGLWSGLVVATLVLAFSLSKIEGWGFGDAVYFMIVSLTTIGYGDITVKRGGGKVLIALYSVVLFVLKFTILYWTQRLRFKQKFSEKSGPVWIDDSSVTGCMKCSEPFGVVRRRHHCRHCGGVFCAVCSRWRISIPQFGHPDPVRVCHQCFQQQAQSNPEIRWSASESNSDSTNPASVLDLVKKAMSQWKVYWKVIAAFLTLWVVMLIGGMVFALIQKWKYLEGLYFTCVTVLTIGYGDFHASKTASKIVLVVYALLGYGLFYWMVVELQATSTRVATKSIEKKRQDLIPLLDRGTIPAPKPTPEKPPPSETA